MYTDWNIRARVKPEHRGLVRRIIEGDEGEFDCTGLPRFMEKWKAFAREFRPPCGGSGKWGFKNQIEVIDGDEVWVMCGSIKNHDYQIEYFLAKVLTKLSTLVEQCWIITDFARDNSAPNELYSSDDEADPEERLIKRFSDQDIRENKHLLL